MTIAHGSSLTAPLSPLTEPFYRTLQVQLRQQLNRVGKDGLLVLDTYNIIYLTGFFHSANERPVGLYLPVHGVPVLFIPLLEKENAEDGWIKDIRTYPEFPGEKDPILWMIRDCGARNLAVDTIPARLLGAAGRQLSSLDISDIVSDARAVKRPEELAFIRAAARYADLCLEAIKADLGTIIRGGGTEMDILAHGVGAAHRQLMQDHGMRLGGTKLGITASVHSGPRAALPHGKTSARVPLAGETLIAGIGASVGGYHAESGVTFLLGAPTPDQRRCMAAMEAANQAAIQALKLGVPCDQINRSAVGEIAAAGFGDFLRHRIGHGMGVQGHEAPWLALGDRTMVRPGMVFSNEPGIYRPGVDGYRTINTMILTTTGVEVPSTFQQRHDLDARVVEL